LVSVFDDSTYLTWNVGYKMQTTYQQRTEIVAACENEIHLRFSTLLYRYLFFGWLFSDLSKAENIFEQNSSWRHNRTARQHLPTYLWRWSIITMIFFGLGYLSNQKPGTSLWAAGLFTFFAVAFTRTMVVFAFWALLGVVE